ncbi:MAG: Fe-Mn family superoxide dismutase [Patescibacteria group bacterium]|jgi:Fe-Mn family superoxide dismutase
MPYIEQSFNLQSINGISEKQMEIHLKLYAGYVKNVNDISTKIDELREDTGKNLIAISELTRRYAFEWNGMRLHELYFSNLGGKDEAIEGELANLITKQFSSIEAWKKEIKAIAMMRGTGWALLVLDQSTNTLKNIWISDHEVGHLAGCDVLFALDVWEHAYLIDYIPAQRTDYIDAVLANIHWATVENRFMK